MLHCSADRLHQLVELEGEYQPPPGVKPAIREVITFLEKVDIIIYIACCCIGLIKQKQNVDSKLK